MSLILNGTDGITFNDSTEMSSAEQTVSAWVRFNGTGTVAIDDSFNVSSITDSGVGLYIINFATAMAHANYAGTFQSGIGSSGSFAYPVSENVTSTRTTTTLPIIALQANQTTKYDRASITASVSGGQ